MDGKLKKLYDKVWPWLVITFGCVVAAVGYVALILPMNMVEGGVTGIGIIAKIITGLPIVGTTSIIITAIVFMIATKKMGKGFGAKSIYATILMNVLIDFLLVLKFPRITNDMLLAAFYGGAIVGVGLGLVYFAGGSTGGADALGQLLWKTKRIPIGRTMLTIDIFVLAAAKLVALPYEQIMYSLIFIYIEIKVVDMVLNGIRATQRVMIVTDEPDLMKAAIFDNLKRGLTIFTGTGGYTGKTRYMLTSVMPKHEIPELRRIISHVDDKSFVIIQDIHQVYGEGFEALPEQLPKALEAKRKKKQKKTKDSE